MKKFLQNKKGVTLLEGLIALLLLAMVATGAFAVLLSNSRRATQPDIREEMIMAVANANEALTTLMYQESGDSVYGLCGNSNWGSTTGPHSINCMLPVVCDRNNSSFSYTVETNETDLPDSKLTNKQYSENKNNKKVTFSIMCNGFTL